MNKMGISAFAKRCFRELSGGQQQRVLLARALCATEKLLFLDEMYALIRSLNREGVTILMISHDLASAVREASHILAVGDSVFFGTKEEWLAEKGGERL